MTIGDEVLATVVVVLGAVGTYLMLPHRQGSTRPRLAFASGAVAAGLALLLFVASLTPPGPFLSSAFFYVFSIAAIVGGLLMVISRDPIASALWFAAVVLSTAGLFLLASASFLAAGTVIVYAGAIIVTFLFVIMLAQMEGRADYDRAARAPGPATFTCFLLLWCLLYALSAIRPARAPEGVPVTEQVRRAAERNLLRPKGIVPFYGLTKSAVIDVLDRALTPTLQIYESPPQVPPGPSKAEFVSTASSPALAAAVEKPNVAGLGGSLYTDHLVTVGLAGALLFVALISAVAIAGPSRPGGVGPDPAQAVAMARGRPVAISTGERVGPWIGNGDRPPSS